MQRRARTPTRTGAGLRAAGELSDAVDALLAPLAGELATPSDPLAIVALGAYGRRELTPRAEVELLFLHGAGLSVPAVAEAVWYPRPHRALRVEPIVRTLE